MPIKKAKRADGRYQTSLSLGFDPETGKRRQKVFYGKTQKEANAKKQAYIKGHSLNPEAKTMTVGKWSAIWLETYAKGGYKSHLNDISIINRFLQYIDKNTNLEDIRPADIQGYAKINGRYTKAHVDKVRRNLTNMFKAAVDNDYILKSPCEGIVWSYIKTGTHEAIPQYIVDLITENWRIHNAGIWAMLIMYAGLRPSEAFALKRENITQTTIKVTDGSHFEHGQLVIVPGEVKTDAGQREIPILPPLKDVIEVLPASGLVCLSATQKPVSQSAYKRNWQAFMSMLEQIHNGRIPQGAGRRSDKFPDDWRYLPEIEMYDLRHTFCSMLYDADVDVKTAQYLMGHSSLDMTLKIYTHLSEKKKQRSYDKLFDFFEK